MGLSTGERVWSRVITVTRQRGERRGWNQIPAAVLFLSSFPAFSVSIKYFEEVAEKGHVVMFFSQIRVRGREM